MARWIGNVAVLQACALGGLRESVSANARLTFPEEKKRSTSMQVTEERVFNIYAANTIGYLHGLNQLAAVCSSSSLF